MLSVLYGDEDGTSSKGQWSETQRKRSSNSFLIWFCFIWTLFLEDFNYLYRSGMKYRIFKIIVKGLWFSVLSTHVIKAVFFFFRRRINLNSKSVLEAWYNGQGLCLCFVDDLTCNPVYCISSSQYSPELKVIFVFILNKIVWKWLKTNDGVYYF